MGINVGMLIFGLFDSALAFFLVYCLWVSWLKGKRIGQILGIIFGTLVFTTYLTLFIWFNSPGVRVRSDIRTIIYAAPIVLTILLSILTLLSQTSKKEEGENDEKASKKPPPVNRQNNFCFKYYNHTGGCLCLKMRLKYHQKLTVKFY